MNLIGFPERYQAAEKPLSFLCVDAAALILVFMGGSRRGCDAVLVPPADFCG
jgi:hypothetical protein